MSVSLMQRLRGDGFLAYRALIAHPLRQLFSGDERSGKEKFLNNYAPEALVAMSEEDREVLRGAARCIHCGLCDAYDLALASLPRTVYDGASLMPIAYSRATPDLVRAKTALGKVDEAQLVRAEAVCPTRVPLRRIAVYLKRKLEQVLTEQLRRIPRQAP